MRMITYPQLKKIHTLLGQMGIMERKPDIVHSLTEGRTKSSREMTLQEAKALIEWLEGTQERKSTLRRIWHLAYEMGIILPGDQDETAMNAAKLDIFCKERGTVKKNISDQSVKELKRTAKQFEAMYGKHVQKQTRLAMLEKLREELEKNIASENYEEAARIKAMIEIQNGQSKTKRKRTPKTV